MRKKRTHKNTKLRVLTVDVGGTHVKFEVSDQLERREFGSGSEMTAKQMVEQVKARTRDWAYDAVSIGYPGVVFKNKIAVEPAQSWSRLDAVRF
jgi:polyphosphate glucokinase